MQCWSKCHQCAGAGGGDPASSGALDPFSVAGSIAGLKGAAAAEVTSFHPGNVLPLHLPQSGG